MSAFFYGSHFEFKKKKKKNDVNCYTTKFRFPTFIYDIPLTER